MYSPQQSTLFGHEVTSRPLTLRDLPRHEHPQGRLCDYGAEYVSDAELLALLLGTGTKQLDALQFAQRLLVDADGWQGLLRSTVAELQHMYGLTEAKAARIKAALAIGQRILKQQPQRVQITSAADIATLLMAEMSYLDQEHLRAVLLSTKNHVIKITTIYIGSINSAAVRIGEVFKEAIKVNAASLILTHNHPSGLPDPSPEDVAVTHQVIEAGRLLGVDVLDHIVIGQGRWVSLRERRLGFTN
jgi:DNA repair protein RadC